MARFCAFFTIGHLDPAQIILRQFLALRIDIDSEDPRRVQPEDLCLDLAGERAVTMFLDQLVRDLESSERLDLPLWRTVPDRVRPPEHMLHPERSDDLTQE